MEKGRDSGSVLVSVCSQRSIGYLGLSRFWSQEHKQSVWPEKLDCTEPPDDRKHLFSSDDDSSFNELFSIHL